MYCDHVDHVSTDQKPCVFFAVRGIFTTPFSICRTLNGSSEPALRYL